MGWHYLQLLHTQTRTNTHRYTKSAINLLVQQTSGTFQMSNQLSGTTVVLNEFVSPTLRNQVTVLVLNLRHYVSTPPYSTPLVLQVMTRREQVTN